MNFRKIGMITLASFLLIGCAKGNEKVGMSDATSTSEDDENINKANIQGSTLNLYTWDGMFPQEVLDDFSKEYAVQINYSNFDYDEDMLAKLAEKKGGDYDVVIADDYILELINKQGLSQKLDQSKLENLKYINPLYRGLFFDPTDEYDVVYGAGIPLIVYNPDVVDFEIDSYNDLWNEKLKDNVGIVGNIRVIDGIVLKSLGYSFNTQNKNELAEAREKLLKLAPNIRVINDTDLHNLLLNGEIGVAFMYTFQVTQALKANPKLKVAYPKEGLGFGTMAMFVPSQAPNAEAAHAFINYILRPEVSAKCFEEIGYYTTNRAAEAFISDDMKQYIILPKDVEVDETIQIVPSEIDDIFSKMFSDFQNKLN